MDTTLFYKSIYKIKYDNEMPLQKPNNGHVGPFPHFCDLYSIFQSIIEGACFQIKMTPNQIIMTAYEEDAFLIIFLRFDSNSLT
jgi:hypothetical protein